MKKLMLFMFLFLFYANESSKAIDPFICDNSDCNYSQLPWVLGHCRFNYPQGSHCWIEVYFYKKEGWCNGTWIRELQITEFFITTNNPFNYCGLDNEAIFKAAIERLLFNWTYACLVWENLQYGQQYTVKIRLPECWYSYTSKDIKRLRYCEGDCCEQEYTLIFNQQGNRYIIGQVTYSNNNPNCEQIWERCTIKPCEWYLPQMYHPPILISDNLDVNNNGLSDKIIIEINNCQTELQINNNNLTNINLELYNILGRNIFKEKLNLSNEGKIYSYYIKDLLPGIYFININYQQYSYKKKLYITNK